MGYEQRNRFSQHADLRAAPMAGRVNGHDPSVETVTQGGIVLPKPTNVAVTADLAFRVADAMASTMVLGVQLVLMRTPDGRVANTVAVPNFAQLLAQAREEWKEPTPAQAAQLALIEAVADCQRLIYERGPAAHAAIKAEQDAKAAADGPPPIQMPKPEDRLPEVGEDRAPEGLA